MAQAPLWPSAGLIVATLLVAAAVGAHSADGEPKCTQNNLYRQPPRGQPPDPVKLDDNAFVQASDGGPVQMKAVSWFGVNDNGTAPIESLWSGGNAAALDMPAIAYQLRSQGFNAIRLPFTFSGLRADPKNMWSKQGCRKVTLGVQAGAAAAAAAPAEPPGAPQCSWYLPDGATLDRFLWSLQWFVANGYYVLAEYHPAGGDTTSRNKQGFVESWQWLWRAVACLPNFKTDLAGRVFVDLLGTPDAAGHRWEAVATNGADAVPGITDLYLKAMDALWEETPAGVSFFVAGAGQGGTASWGTGFTTDKATIAVNDFSDPNPFFKALLKKPYRRAVVISPSVYRTDAPAPPPDDTPTLGAPVKAPAWPEGAGPIKVMDTTFTYLAREGYCAGGDCQRFPVAVGEFASRLSGVADLGALNAFAAHLAEAGVPFEGVGTWRFWGFNGAAS